MNKRLPNRDTLNITMSATCVPTSQTIYGSSLSPRIGLNFDDRNHLLSVTDKMAGGLPMRSGPDCFHALNVLASFYFDKALRRQWYGL